MGDDRDGWCGGRGRAGGEFGGRCVCGSEVVEAELLKEAIEGNEDLTPPTPLKPEELFGVGEVGIDWEVVAGAAGGGVEAPRVNDQHI